jgi:very-short-patch-repair endonuclease
LKRHEASGLARGLAFFDADARANKKRLRAVGRSGKNGHELYVALEQLSTLPAEWRGPGMFAALDRSDPQQLLEKIDRIVQRSPTLEALAKPSEPLSSLRDLLALAQTYQRTQTNAYKAVTAHATRETITAAGFASVLKELERVPRPAALWPDVFEAIWLRSNIEQIGVADPRIAGFDRARFEAVIEQFGRLDLDRLTLAARRIRRSAAEAYFKAQKDFPEQAVVFRTNLARKIKQLPLRKLMEQADQVTMALCPCWMASPLSVSQLTDPRSKFDVVIFDEASQVLPEDAITSIIRGTRVVIAGDKHQLPPTTFFAGTGESDEDEEDDGTSQDNSRNIESILDLMSIYVRPQSLEWHYRSLDERLIAFSNKEFYGNSLVTFPSREEPPPAMQHHLVEETKRDGDEESNSAEVLRVVELVLDHAEHRPSESLGVIAMGIKHATRIEKTLYETRRQRPELDAFFSDRGERTFFCKNLERVQGDERDAIILSVGYGKNIKGDMVYRFGPINNAGGERRLNVAVSRAVRRMTLVSSFRSIDMDDKKLNATGAKVLKRYIRFAESDGRDLGDDAANDKIPMNDFETDIYNALSARGLSLVSQWGTSSYRLDFAVQDPRAPGSFCLAIECDGATYHSAQTARDRDRIRQTHLEAQGWKFHRIWSTDWFNDRFGETERAVAAYQAALNSKTPAPVQAAVPELAPAIEAVAAQPPQAKRTGARPRIIAGAAIDTYTSSDLLAVVTWIVSDGLLRTEDELLREAARELGYARVGSKIDRTLRSVIDKAHLG